MSAGGGASLRVWAPDGIGEVVEGADLVDLVARACPDLADGDVVTLTSKILSKAEGRVRAGDRESALAEETVRLVARRGRTAIVENRLGLVMAAAGIDDSNVAVGSIVLLPLDPDSSARAIRADLAERLGVNVAVLITDTAGRAWRIGQTDLAIGAAGIQPTLDHAGQADPYGNLLEVTAPAIVDELAAAAELAKTKLGGRPVAVVRGLPELVLPRDQHGPGARALTRRLDQDLFSLGSREAVLAAIRGDRTGFAAVSSPDDVRADLGSIGLTAAAGDDELHLPGLDEATRTRVQMLALAHGWLAESVDSSTTLRRPHGQSQ